MDYDKIIVLDFGSQYNQLIARRIRELHIYSELVPHTIRAEEIKKMTGLKGIILSGGPHSVYDQDFFDLDEEIFNLNLPILGICYGMQLLSKKLGGMVKESPSREFGKTDIEVDTNSFLFQELDSNQRVWMSHKDFVSSLPDGFKGIAHSDSTPFAAMANEEKKIYGLQFHPEVMHTEHGKKILSNFALKVCKANQNFTMDAYIDTKVKEIRDLVQDKKVLCGLSGGVDSSVAATLIYKAIGNQLQCVFVDNGLLRKDEAKLLKQVFQDRYHFPLVMTDASDTFLTRLSGVTEPEKKRKIIGSTFIDIFKREQEKLGQFDFLAQGTLYTDVIESGTASAQTIKSHHNVGGLPKELGFRLLEPLNKLFKDEVRSLGLSLGLPKELVYRQPFPGPGLSIRILGEITKEKLDIVRESDAILRDEFQKAKHNESVWQYFTFLPNIKTVGVMGDERTYFHAVGIRAVTSVDGMTADWARVPYEVLDIVSRRIVNEVGHVNRVIYDITSKPPGTIEWE